MPHAAISEAKKRRAKTFRRRMTGAERKLWYALRAHRFEGLGFRRQVPLGRYILDFVCHDRGFVIEVDGGQHFSGPQAARDVTRDRWLKTQGFRVIRIANNEVLTNLECVLEYLVSVIHETPLTTRTASRISSRAAADSPLPPCGGARLRFARSEGGKSQIQHPQLTPLPTLPHKGGGVPVAPSGQNADVPASDEAPG